MHRSGKTAIVCCGGSMRNAHTAGFLHALEGQALAPTPDMYVASSGAAIIASYAAADQYEYLQRAFEELLPTRRFMSYTRYPFINIDYLIDDVVSRAVPLDVERIRRGSSRVVAPVVDALNGAIRFFDDTYPAFHELLRATCAVPLLYGKAVKLDGQRYVDGGIGCSLQTHVDKAVELGADRILALCDAAPPGTRRRIAVALGGWALGSGALIALKRGLLRKSEVSVPAHVRFLHVPTPEIPAGIVTHSRRKIHETWQIGEASARRHAEQIRELFAA